MRQQFKKVNGRSTKPNRNQQDPAVRAHNVFKIKTSIELGDLWSGPMFLVLPYCLQGLC